MARVDEANLFADDWDDEHAREGNSWRVARVGERVGGRRIGASLYEIEPGLRSWPYHFHYGNEEWLLVVAGRPTLRTPDGERELAEGDVVCFPAGPGGAHSVENRSDEPARVLMLSTLVTPSISVYPDSDKVGVRPGVPEDTLNFLRPDAVDYWAGEE
jgi:uncharacterized cupin superfamily protein